jgi:drug/metabolite transporter (DMT)-like permease
MRVLGEWFPVFLAQGLRFLAAGIGLLIISCCAGGVRALRATRRQLAHAAVVGFLLLVTSGAVVIYAERFAPSSLAALLSSTVPLWSLLIMSASGRSMPRVVSGLAVCLGLAGVAIVAWPGNAVAGAPVRASLLLVGASFSAALGGYLGGRLDLPGPARLATAYETLIAGMIVISVGLATGEAGALRLAEVPWSGWFAFGYLVTVGSMLTLSVFSWMVTQLPLTTVATYSYVNPVVAVIIGVVLLDEQVTARFFAGGGVILIATFVIVSTSARSGRVPPAVLVPSPYNEYLSGGSSTGVTWGAMRLRS